MKLGSQELWTMGLSGGIVLLKIGAVIVVAALLIFYINPPTTNHDPAPRFFSPLPLTLKKTYCRGPG